MSHRPKDSKEDLKVAIENFEQEYLGIYGERWPRLKHALLQSSVKAILIRDAAKFPLSETQIDFLDQPAYLAPPSPDEASEEPNSASGPTTYQLDPASIWVAERLIHALRDRSGPYQILDLCAAPGGKSLVIGYWLEKTEKAAESELHCNEPSATRRGRLKKVLREFIPDPAFRIVVQGKPGQVFGRAYPGQYDAVLVDAPCSSERHVLHDPRELAQWSPSRSKRLAQQQFRLIEAAIYSLKKSGSLIYSTCSLHPRENDEVIEKILRRYGEEVKLETPPGDTVEKARGELTRYGVMHLPDQSGLGPLYSAVLTRV